MIQRCAEKSGVVSVQCVRDFHREWVFESAVICCCCRTGGRAILLTPHGGGPHGALPCGPDPGGPVRKEGTRVVSPLGGVVEACLWTAGARGGGVLADPDRPPPPPRPATPEGFFLREAHLIFGCRPPAAEGGALGTGG